MKYIKKWLGLQEVSRPTFTFTELVKLHFGFLVDEFGFSISTEISKSGDDSFEDGAVKFESPKLLVRVYLNRDGSVTVFFSLPNRHSSFDYTTILELVKFLSQGNDKTLLKSYAEDEKRQSWIERQIIENAQALQKYGHQIFDKESFEWFELITYKKEQAEILYQSTPNKE